MEPQQQDNNRNDAPLVVVWHPDGSLAIGADPAHMSHKAPSAAASSITARQPTLEETAAAQAALEGRRRAACKYRDTTLRRRQNIFLALIVCDLLFFLGMLIYQGLQRQQMDQNPWSDEFDDPARTARLPDLDSHERHLSWDSNSFVPSGKLPVSWWLDLRALRIEDLVFSIAMDLLGITGAVQLRTALLSLYCIIQVLSTAALSTGAGISLSLFTMFRLGLLLLAFYLRSAVLVYTALLEAAELPLPPNAAARLQRALSNPVMSGLFGTFFGARSQRGNTSSNRPAPSTNQATQERNIVPASSGSSRTVLLHSPPGVVGSEAERIHSAGDAAVLPVTNISSSCTETQ